MPLLGRKLSSHSRERAPVEVYDHQISLVDHTQSQEQRRTSFSPSHRNHSTSSRSSLSSGHSDAQIGRKWTLREELARRKYSKWQAETVEPPPATESSGPDEDERGRSMAKPHTASKSLHHKMGRVRTKTGKNSTLAASSSEKIDVLYENQRGSFLCGFPLFSHKSLLNFDPSPWTTAAFKDSPVNIATAQVPDPSWRWDWKSWYVDMSTDVDDEGWQYSFSFSPMFSWHGVPIWFDSFVRRRCWLRKRVRRSGSSSSQESGSRYRQSLRERMLNSEYFTVRPPRSNSQLSKASSKRRPGTGAGEAQSTGLEEWKTLLQSVSDIGSLMFALKMAKIDREKVEAVDQYLEGERVGLEHLADKIPEIMASLVFQTSRRKLLAHLSSAFHAASQAQETKDSSHDSNIDGEHGHELDASNVEKLWQAAKVADDEVKHLEYWSDVKGMAKSGDTVGAADEDMGWGPDWQGVDGSGPADFTDAVRVGDVHGRREGGHSIDKGKQRE